MCDFCQIPSEARMKRIAQAFKNGDAVRKAQVELIMQYFDASRVDALKLFSQGVRIKVARTGRMSLDI